MKPGRRLRRADLRSAQRQPGEASRRQGRCGRAVNDAESAGEKCAFDAVDGRTGGRERGLRFRRGASGKMGDRVHVRLLLHRKQIDMVAAFAVDRLGRSLPDLIAFLSDLQAQGTSFADVREGFHQRGMKIGTVEVD